MGLSANGVLCPRLESGEQCPFLIQTIKLLPSRRSGLTFLPDETTSARASMCTIHGTCLGD